MFVVQFEDGTYRKGRGVYYDTYVNYYHTKDIRKARVYRLVAHAKSSMDNKCKYNIIPLQVIYPNTQEA